MTILISTQIIEFADGSFDAKLGIINKDSQADGKIRISDVDYRNWILRGPVPMESSKGEKPLRAKRSIHKEQIPGYLATNISPYSSIVYVSIGCTGTLVSPIHVLTAAHCIHDGVKIRRGTLMNRLKIRK